MILKPAHFPLRAIGVNVMTQNGHVVAWCQNADVAYEIVQRLNRDDQSYPERERQQ